MIKIVSVIQGQVEVQASNYIYMLRRKLSGSMKFTVQTIKRLSKQLGLKEKVKTHQILYLTTMSMLQLTFKLAEIKRSFPYRKIGLEWGDLLPQYQ
jgi:hypothetical protein